MSIPQFSSLTEEEKNLLLDTPVIVTYLIGGSDDNLDENEKQKSNHLVHIRAATGDPILFDFYKEIENSFALKLNGYVAKYGNLQASERTRVLVEELTKLNEILPKLNDIYARALLKSMRSLAHAIAEVSGGFFGFLDVSYEEKHLTALEMITYEP
ncbi:MAG TPA: hypothetical protein PK431_14770 [Chitinophagales bacterium]|nr:hypothetical protein [Chitinophagales bacterium]